MVAFLLEDMLDGLGFEVAVESQLEPALQALDSLEPDIAILDVNLGGGKTSLPIAEHLQSRGIPFIFATGYGRGYTEDAYPKVPVVQKPFTEEQLREALGRVLAYAP